MIRIRLAILDRDQDYLSRFTAVFGTKFADTYEVHSFTDAAIAIGALDANKIDVFIADDAFDIDASVLPRRCSFAYLVDSNGVDSVKGQRAICRFQRSDLIDKQIKNIYSENPAVTRSGLIAENRATNVLIFSSPSGGAGTSSATAACALHFASAGRRALYLNLEKFGCADVFFSGDLAFGMSDVIYALRSGKTNLSMKLASCVKQDMTGVYFYSQAKSALDMFELTDSDIIRLMNELIASGLYDYIIIDMDFGIGEEYLRICRQANILVWVGDGSETSNAKIQRAYQALVIKEQNDDESFLDRICLFYNKFGSETGRMLENIGLRCIGGSQIYVHATARQIMTQLASKDIFDKIIIQTG